MYVFVLDQNPQMIEKTYFGPRLEGEGAVIKFSVPFNGETENVFQQIRDTDMSLTSVSSFRPPAPLHVVVINDTSLKLVQLGIVLSPVHVIDL